jgi:hypothetical protein
MPQNRRLRNVLSAAGHQGERRMIAGNHRFEGTTNQSRRGCCTFYR